MGVVYLASDLGGAQVALKSVRVTEARLVESIRREIRTLSRLGHPGIVRILAHGVRDGMPWYSMAFEEGQTLRARMASGAPLTTGQTGDAPATRVARVETPEGVATAQITGAIETQGIPPPAPSEEYVEVALAIVRSLCAPLSYLHGEGLVHRDLKPENVVVRPDGSPVIVDFGLAAELGTEREDVDAALDPSGTALYMAPEQWVGGLIDARADVYALGCIAYELLTGRPPFFGANAKELAYKHRTAMPIALSQLAPAIPREVEALVMRLLAKHPKERIGHLEDVARALERYRAPDAAPDPPPRARAYLYRAELAGREVLLDALRARLRELGGSEGGLVRLRGESGVGKTRVALAAMEEARRRRIPCLAGRCEPGEAVALRPFRAVLVAVADRCRERGEDEVARLLDAGGRRAHTFAPFEPSLLELPGVDRTALPVKLPPDAARQRLFADFADLLTALSDGRPLVVVIDDLQWADDLSLAALSSLVRSGRLATIPVLVLATERAEEETAATSELFAREGTTTLDVPRLEGGAIRSIVSDMLADPTPSAELVASLHESSEGNPFFVAEYLRTLVLEGKLARSEGRWRAAGKGASVEALALSSGLQTLVGARLDALDSVTRGVLDAAAVLGRDLDAELVAAVLGIDGQDLAEPLCEMARRHLIDERGPGRYRFDHDKIREVALARLDAATRRSLHGRAAATLSARRGDDPDAQAELGRHFREAGDLPEARRRFLAAARRAYDTASLLQSERHYRTVVDLCGGVPHTDGIAARVDLARQVLSTTGRIPEGLRMGEEALAEARALGDRAAMASSMVSVCADLDYLRRSEESARVAEELHAIQVERGDRRGQQEALQLLAQAVKQHGTIAEAEAYQRRALQIVEELDDPAELCRVLVRLNHFACERGNVAEHRAIMARAMELARASGDRRLVAFTLRAAFWGDWVEGRFAEAMATMTEALAIDRATGNRLGELADLTTLGLVHHSMGRNQEAVAAYRRGLAMAREYGNRHVEIGCLVNLEGRLIEEGALDEARRVNAEALALARETKSRREEVHALMFHSHLERIAGDLGVARQELERAVAIAKEIGYSRVMVELHLQRGHMALALGEDAAPHLAAAKASTADLLEKQHEGFMAELEATIEAVKAGTGGLHRGELTSYWTDGLRRAVLGP